MKPRAPELRATRVRDLLRTRPGAICQAAAGRDVTGRGSQQSKRQREILVGVT